MEYKGFTYTPIPKTAWDNLSMLEKSEMMKVAVRNGITDLKTIKEKYNEFAEGGGMEGSMNTIPEDYAPLASPTWQPTIDKMKQNSYKSNVEDFAYRVQKMHPEITQQQVEEAYKSVPIIASDSRRGRETGKYVFGDESGYGQRIMLYPNRMKEDQGVGGLTKEDQLRSAMGHETNHLYVHTLLGDNHTDEEKALLDAAYPDDLFHVPEGGNIYDEKRAYNMQVRNALSKSYGNVVGADYDKTTEKMKPNDVMWNYSQLGSGYMSDYQKVKQKYKKGSKWDQNQVDAILKATKDVAYTPAINLYEHEEGVNYAALGGSLIEDAMNRYRDGGGIHIKPSKRGTFTAAAKKHGMGVQEFASKVLAHPENYSPAMRKKANFAKNVSHWKHGFGGNLFDGNSQPTQKMQIGLRVTNDWKPFTLDDVLANAARIEQKKQTMEDRLNNVFTLSNDATSVANGRPQNKHLERRAVEGAKQHAAWEKKHPILNTVGLGLTTIPFVAAASPILAPAGEAFAGTTLADISAPMWTDAALTAGFGAHGLQDLASGNADWVTALEVAPLGRLAKPIFNETAMAIKNYRYPLGRPQIPENFLTIKPQVRTRVGDVEIDNPQLFYRQGSAEMGDDFIKSGVVRTSGGFENPMYTEGALFRKVPTRTKGGLSKGDRVALEGPYSKTKSDLLVTDSSVDMIPADQGSGKNYTLFKDYILNPFAEESIFDKSRVPLFDGTANSANTTAYRWEPEYGYRKILAEESPAAEQSVGKTASQITAENAASMTPKVNWDANNWFKTISGRNSYSSEEAAELASHVPEYRNIEQRLFNEGKLALDSNGNIIVVDSEMSPQEYIMRQSKAFQKMNPEHHYVGVSKGKIKDFEEGIYSDFDSWTTRTSPKDVEEYAISPQGGHTISSEIEKIRHQKQIREENFELHQEQLKWKLDHNKISQEEYDQSLKSLKENFTSKQQEENKELELLIKQLQIDPLNGGKVFDITFPLDAKVAPTIDAQGAHWQHIPYENNGRPTTTSTDHIVSTNKKLGYDVSSIDNVMDTFDGTLLNESIIHRGTPVKSVLGNTGSFDIKGPNKHNRFRGLFPWAIGLSSLGLIPSTLPKNTYYSR